MILTTNIHIQKSIHKNIKLQGKLKKKSIKAAEITNFQFRTKQIMSFTKIYIIPLYKLSPIVLQPSIYIDSLRLFMSIHHTLEAEHNGVYVTNRFMVITRTFFQKRLRLCDLELRTVLCTVVIYLLYFMLLDVPL